MVKVFQHPVEPGKEVAKIDQQIRGLQTQRAEPWFGRRPVCIAQLLPTTNCGQRLWSQRQDCLGTQQAKAQGESL
jgi:hypothetical protein